MNPNRTSCVPLLLLLPFLLLLPACGEEDRTPESASGAPDTLPRLPEIDPSAAYPDYNPEDRESFEEAIYLQYLHLKGQVSKQAIDSIMRTHMRNTKDLKSLKEKADQELDRLMERQDTLARHALATQFSISLDSVDAILKGRVDE